MEISSAQMQQAAAPSDSGAAAADGGVAPERSRVARLMEVVSLAGGTAEHLCEALLRVGPDAEDLMVLRVRPPLAPFHLRLARGHPRAPGLELSSAPCAQGSLVMLRTPTLSARCRLTTRGLANAICAAGASPSTPCSMLARADPRRDPRT